MISEEMKSLRIDSGYTQESFAEALQVSKQAVSSWEHKERIPGQKSIRNIRRFIMENPNLKDNSEARKRRLEAIEEKLKDYSKKY